MKNLKLIDFDINGFVQKKPTYRKGSDGKLIEMPKDKWLEYIEWSVVWQILNENYDYVEFSSRKHPDYPNTLIIILVIGDDKIDNTYEMNYPIINGNIPITTPSQLDIHKAELRGFVKAAAKYTGLGLGLWQKDEVQTEAVKEKRQITEKLIKSKTTISDLMDVWKTLSESEQHQYDDLFKKQKKAIIELA